MEGSNHSKGDLMKKHTRNPINQTTLEPPSEPIDMCVPGTLAYQRKQEGKPKG